MQMITPAQAFSLAPPRCPAVVCLPGPRGSTDMIAAQWFTWLNTTRQPMLSFSLARNASLGLDIKPGDEVYLAFPPAPEALRYAPGVRTAERGREKALPEGVTVALIEGFSLLFPAQSEVVLRCELAGAYNFPFKKVRIFNCNLQEARGALPAEPEF